MLSAAPLTESEAARRRAELDVHSYEVDLDLSQAETADTFTSTTTVDFTCAAGDEGTWIELKADELLSAELNGAALDAEAWHGGRLALRDLRPTNQLVVQARFSYSRTGQGLHRYTDPQDGLVYLYVQDNLEDAARVLACFDQPDLKATFTVSVTAPPSWVVLGNGLGEQHSPGRWQFATTPPISTYLFAIVAGPYHGVQAVHDGIELGLWCRKSWAPFLDVERLLGTTRAGFDYFHQLFDVRYPFGKYDQAFVPEFNLGAMENPGLVTFRDERYLQRGTVTQADRELVANTQMHEMAHMWFGNLVTMQWWNDLWLNESFAEYLGSRAVAEATEHTDAWITFLAHRKSWGYDADQLSTTHPVAGEAVDTRQALLNFDGISYAKGASVLRQLVHWLGDDAFLAGLRQHFADHAFANATLADLVAAFTAASGRDVQTWADQWLRTSGTSTLRCEVCLDGEGRYQSFAVHQSGTALRPHRFNVGLYDLVDGHLTRRQVIDVHLPPTTQIDVPELVGQPAADLVLPNDGDLTFALIELDDASLATVLGHLADLPDQLARALIWRAVTTMLGEGRLPISEYVDLVTQSLSEQDALAVAVEVLQRTCVATRTWAATEERPRLLARLSTALADRANAATPGGDYQLALVRSLVSVSTDVALLQAWRAGTDLPAGLTSDADLRWRLVTRLCALGALSEKDIEAERATDPSTAGANRALTARAALPISEAKEWAWQAATTASLSNHELQAVADGFWQTEQAELLTPYVERFGTEFPELSQTQAIELVVLFGRSMFPVTQINEAALAMAEGLLRTSLSPAAHRLVAERRDNLSQALRARHGSPA